jgi:hypothetical protein
VSDGRLRLVVRQEDLSKHLAFGRVQPLVISSAEEKGESLVGVISVRDIMVAYLGLRTVAREDSALASVTDDAERSSSRGVQTSDMTFERRDESKAEMRLDERR